MFRPIGADLQVFKVHKIKITIENSFCVGRLRSKSFEVALYTSLRIDWSRRLSFFIELLVIRYCFFFTRLVFEIFSVYLLSVFIYRLTTLLQSLVL